MSAEVAVKPQPAEVTLDRAVVGSKQSYSTPCESGHKDHIAMCCQIH